MTRKKADSANKKPTPKKATPPVAEKAAPATVKKESAPVEEKAAPATVKKEAAPKKATSVEEKAAPAAAKKESAPKKAAPVEEKAAPAAAKKESAPKKAAPVEEKAAPAAAKKEAAPKKATSVEEKAAPATVKKEAAPKKAAPVEEKAVPATAKKEAAPKKAAPVEEKAAPAAEAPAPVEVMTHQPRRSVAFIGSECYPFVKTGGLGDVMYALPRELVRLNCDVRVILPRYACIPKEYQDKMVYRGEFYMDLGRTGRNYYVGIMEYIHDGVVYDFIDNQEFFSTGNPYINLVDDIPKYCFFSKAALAALNYMNWIPDNTGGR